MGAKVGVVGKRQQGCPVSPREPGPSGAPTDQEARVPHLVCVIGKVDLVENLGGFVLDGLHLHQVRGVLPGPVSENQRGAGERGQVRRQQIPGAMGSREQRALWRQANPVLIPSHHFLPGDKLSSL